MNLRDLCLRPLLLTGLAVFSSSVFALVITDSSLSLTNIQITPTSGTLVFQGPLTTEVYAQSANSLGELDQQFGSTPGGAISRSASASWASSGGQADASAMTLSAFTAVNLPGFYNQASSLGRASLYGTFMITGGTGPVDVLFSMDVAGSLHGFTDEVGSFDPDWTASLLLDSVPILIDYEPLVGGPNFPDTVRAVNRNLNTMLSLLFGTPYFLYIDADAESSRNQNLPEPGTVVLLMIGLGGLAASRRRPLQG